MSYSTSSCLVYSSEALNSVYTTEAIGLDEMPRSVKETTSAYLYQWTRKLIQARFDSQEKSLPLYLSLAIHMIDLDLIQ